MEHPLLHIHFVVLVQHSQLDIFLLAERRVLEHIIFNPLQSDFSLDLSLLLLLHDKLVDGGNGKGIELVAAGIHIGCLANGFF